MRKSATLLAILAFFASSDARAENYRNRLAVLPIVIEGEHGKASLSSIFKDVDIATSRRLGINLISDEEVFAVSRDGLGSSILLCESDNACIASKLRAFNARYGLVVVISFDVNPPILSVQLVDTDGGRLIGQQVTDTKPSDGAALSAAIQGATRELLDKGGFTLAGRLIVEVDPPAAQIRLGKGIEPDTGTPNVFTLAPGNYPVQAQLDGYDGATGTALIQRGAETRVQLSLSKQTSLIESPWLWIGVGAVVVGAATTGVVLASKPNTRCICIMFGTDCSASCPE